VVAIPEVGGFLAMRLLDQTPHRELFDFRGTVLDDVCGRIHGTHRNSVNCQNVNVELDISLRVSIIRSFADVLATPKELSQRVRSSLIGIVEPPVREASELYAIDKHVSIMLVPFELPAELTAICLTGKDPFDDRPGVVRVI
jgi:hypothetical protein